MKSPASTDDVSNYIGIIKFLYLLLKCKETALWQPHVAADDSIWMFSKDDGFISSKLVAFVERSFSCRRDGGGGSFAPHSPHITSLFSHVDISVYLWLCVLSSPISSTDEFHKLQFTDKPSHQGWISDFIVVGNTKEGCVYYVRVFLPSTHWYSSWMCVAVLWHSSSVSLAAVLPPILSCTTCLTVLTLSNLQSPPLCKMHKAQFRPEIRNEMTYNLQLLAKRRSSFNCKDCLYTSFFRPTATRGLGLSSSICFNCCCTYTNDLRLQQTEKFKDDFLRLIDSLKQTSK